MSSDLKIMIFSSKNIVEGNLVQQYGIEYLHQGVMHRIGEITDEIVFISEIASLLKSENVEACHFKDVIEDCIVKKFTLLS